MERIAIEPFRDVEMMTNCLVHSMPAIAWRWTRSRLGVVDARAAARRGIRRPRRAAGGRIAARKIRDAGLQIAVQQAHAAAAHFRLAARFI